MPSFIYNGILIAIIAHGVIGISLVWDKILLENPETQDVINYTFWLGAMSVLGVCLVPFGFRMPSLRLFLIAFVAGVANLVANYFYYNTLKHGEASENLAIMGGFTPLITFLLALGLLKEPLEGASLYGFGLMVGGGFVMFLAEEVNYKVILPMVLAAAVAFAISSDVQKIAFDETNFVTGYVIFTLGTFAAALFLLVRKKWREEIFRTSEQASPRSKTLYFINRFINGVGSFLIFFAISHASPAVVSAISGLRYVIIFVAVYCITKWHPQWLKEDFRGRTLVIKTIGTLMVIAGLVLLGLTSRQGAQLPA